MTAFEIPRSLESLRLHYPLPSELLRIAACGGVGAARTIAQLWLSEGIPAAFRDCPAVYDAARDWLGDRLDVHPKEIGLVGSARLGRSMAPHKLDQPFGVQSDLDLFIVSKGLFDAISGEFLRWCDDYTRGIVQPRNSTEKKYWTDNHARGPVCVSEWGFVDSNRVPYWARYPIAQRIAQTMYSLTVKLAATPYGPSVKRASLRCYSDWGRAITRMLKNLQAAQQFPLRM